MMDEEEGRYREHHMDVQQASSNGDVLPPNKRKEEGSHEETLCCGILEKDEDDPDFGCLVGPCLLSLLIVVCGTTSTVTSKIMYEIKSHGVENCRENDDDENPGDYTHYCAFTKPWFQTLVMKLAMSICYFIHKGSRWYRKRQHDKASSSSSQRRLRRKKKAAAAVFLDEEGEASRSLPLLTSGDDDDDESFEERFPSPSAKAVLFIAWPALTDLLQTVLAQAGLLWVNSSVYTMMRGSVIIFTCFFSIKYMGKTMTITHWAAIAIVCAAIVLVGVAGVFGEDDTNVNVGNYILGIGLILAGQVVGAVQFVLEEYIMTSNWGVTPTLLVGWEGLWGTFMFLFLTPFLYYTPRDSDMPAATVWHENVVDTWNQLKNSKDLIVINVVAAAALLVYNMVGNMVTKQLSSIMRSILESCRTLGVWTAGLVLYYHFHDHQAGEQWTNWSFLELLGFALLVYGTLAYKGITTIPGMPPIS